MADIPRTYYAKTSDGASIAYQTLGDGPSDVALLPSMHCIDLMWDEPSFEYFLRRLAGIGRLICLDWRGNGASDPFPLGGLPTPEGWMEDLRAVLDAVGSTSVSVIGPAYAGPIALLFAATYPERTKALVLIDATVRMMWAEDYPIGARAEVVDDFLMRLEQAWGNGAMAPFMAPSRAGDKGFRRWQARNERLTQPPASVVAGGQWSTSLDLRPVLSTIQVPTLVLHHQHNPLVPLEHGRYLADGIAGAVLRVLAGQELWFFTEGSGQLLDVIEEFITGVAPIPEPDRLLATVLFTDIVGSTEHATRLGDKAWKELLERHDIVTDRQIERFRGRTVRTTGDGVLATFDGPARALRCAQAIREGVRSLGIELRCGLHTGEIDLLADNIGGIAVHIGQRICTLADAGEVLLSSTVKDLVVGSGIEFTDRGEHELKGVPGAWKLFAVVG